MPTRRPYGSGHIKPIVRNGKVIAYQIRWSLGTDPFTGKHLRKAETLHGVTKAEAQRILNQRTTAAHQARENVITCPGCGATFPRT